MKKILALLLFLPLLAWGQCNPFVANQVLTATQLNAALSAACITSGTISGVMGTTQSRIDNTTALATDAFVNQQIASATANVPFPLVGGTYNQATNGTGLQVVVFVSGGTISSILSVVNGGSGYAVGDLIIPVGGNTDAVLRVTNVVGGVVQSGGVSVIYGGTSYTTGATVTVVPVPPGQRTVSLTGTLTSNVTFIIQNGTFLTAARRIQFNNNTTGAFTVTVKLSNGSGGTVGTGVVLPQGTNNSSAVLVETDGMNDVWLADTLVGLGAGTMATQNANAVAITGGSGAFSTLSASSTITPSQTAGIVGTTTNNNANAGSFGEYRETRITTDTAISLSTATNLTSISLTPGDWDVDGIVNYTTGTTTTQALVWISTTSATIPGTPDQTQTATNLTSGQLFSLLPMRTRISVASTTTVYLGGFIAGSGSPTYRAIIRARRVR